MHIASGFLSPPVWGTMAAVSGAALAGSVAAARRQLDERKVPLMGVMGAFVFAAQMVNFPVLPGTSGHLGGGFLLGVVLGPALGIVVMASVLVVQSLVFQDGGVEALGANVFAMGVVPCLMGGFVRHLWRRSARGVYAATVLGATLAVVIGATLIVVWFALSGYSQRLAEGRTLLYALGLMDGIHVLIGLVEGFVSVAVIRFVVATRAEALWEPLKETADEARPRLKRYNRRTLAAGLAVVLVVGGVVSYFAATAPDGLEKSQEALGIAPLYGEVSAPPSLFEEYGLKGLGNAFLGNAAAGIVGSMVVLGLLLGVAYAVMRRRRSASASEPA